MNGKDVMTSGVRRILTQKPKQNKLIKTLKSTWRKLCSIRQT